MSLSVEVVRNLGNNKVLIQEKSGTEKKPVERYYVAPQENADEFIKRRRNAAVNNRFQRTMTYFMKNRMKNSSGLYPAGNRWPMNGSFMLFHLTVLKSAAWKSLPIGV